MVAVVWYVFAWFCYVDLSMPHFMVHVSDCVVEEHALCSFDSISISVSARHETIPVPGKTKTTTYKPFHLLKTAELPIFVCNWFISAQFGCSRTLRLFANTWIDAIDVVLCCSSKPSWIPSFLYIRHIHIWLIWLYNQTIYIYIQIDNELQWIIHSFFFLF